MSTKYPGGFITKSPVAPTTTAASGVWTLDQQQQYQKAGTWPAPPIFIEDLFSTYLVTGDGTAPAVNNGIDVSGQGGLVWIKKRSAAGSHSLFDTARGANLRLISNDTAAQDSVNLSFTSTGFSNYTFDSAVTYASWTFRKQPKFFDVVTYTGDGVSGRTVSHNLGSVPGFIVTKPISTSGAWAVAARKSDGNYAYGASTYAFGLNSNEPATSRSVSGLATDTTFTPASVADVGTCNNNGVTYVAYLFAHDAGGFPVSGGGSTNGISCGSYTGNGSTSGPTISLGYEPQWVMIKNATDATNWAMFDNMRGIATGGTEQRLYANTSGAEVTTQGNDIDLTATGFDIKTDLGYLNTSGSTFIYIAIRRGPMKPPTVGTSVFSPNTTSDDGNAITTGFPVDMFIEGLRAGNAINQAIMDRLRGNGSVLTTSSTNAQSSVGEGGFASNTTIKPGLFGGGSPAIVWNFRRAPNFCDVVCYTGNGSTQTVTHNLGVAPELMIMKKRSVGGTSNWAVYATPLANVDGYLFLNDTAAVATSSVLWNSTAPTSTVFSLGASTNINQNGETAIAYLFATLAGVSKVGSYTGTGALLTVNCGFTSGARFVLIKRTDSTGDWWTYDSARGITSGNDPYLFMNSTAAEVTGTNYVDTDTTGFQVTAAAPAEINANGGTFIFLAIA